MLRVIAIELDEDSYLLDARIAEAVALAVAGLNPDNFFGPDGSLHPGFDPGAVVITNAHGRVLRVVQYDVNRGSNVVEFECVPWW